MTVSSPDIITDSRTDQVWSVESVKSTSFLENISNITQPGKYFII